MTTWDDRAAAFVAEVIARAASERPGDAAHAIAALRASTGAWHCRHEWAASRTGAKALGRARAAAIVELRGGAPRRPCPACGAAPSKPCRVMGGEIQPSEIHEARKELTNA
jgi:hypothetical protein